MQRPTENHSARKTNEAYITAMIALCETHFALWPSGLAECRAEKALLHEAASGIPPSALSSPIPSKQGTAIETMPHQLCSICRVIPENFWSKEFDLFESRRGAKAKLQSYNSMQVQKKKGCHLCTLFVDYIWMNKLRDHNECLYLWRGYGDPHRAFCLATKGFPDSLGRLYFFRVPDVWCK